MNLGVGQFCTNPGIVCGVEDAGFTAFSEEAVSLATAVDPSTMLHEGIFDGYQSGVDRLLKHEAIQLLDERLAESGVPVNKAKCVLLGTHARLLEGAEHILEDEVFGPTSILVTCESVHDMIDLADKLEGHLTATVHGTEEDLETYKSLIQILEKKVGRLIFNGFPTGIEVCAAMHHGGPYPATTDSHFTSIGTGAILRFGRPICYQNFPQSALPKELRDANEMGIWRLVDNELTKAGIH